MISLRNVTKRYEAFSGPRVVLEDISFDLGKGQRIGILGGNGSGKSTLIRIVGGASRPTSGTVESSMSVSWPLAFGGAFQGSLSGLDNLRFVCRVYGVEFIAARQIVEEFSELGRMLREPVKNYSSGMRARFAFGVSLAVDFDCFLIDEVVAVGDARFRAKCEAELFERRADRAMLLVSHDEGFVRQHCHLGTVLRDGRLGPLEPVGSAFDTYRGQESGAA